MNFDELGIRLRELYDKIRSQDYFVNESYDIVKVEFNEVFLNLITASKTEKKYFSCSPLEVYTIHLNEEIKICKEESFDFYENEYLQTEYLQQIKILNTSNTSLIEYPYYLVLLDRTHYNLFRSILKQRIEYLEKLLFKKGIEVIVRYPNGDTSRIVRDFKKHINIMVENDNLQPLTSTQKPKTNKSLLFNGKELNLSERFKIANEVLGIDTKIRTLKIGDLEKYQLLAYILGCDKDNARNLMNGSYKTKDRDLSTYFNDLGLNK